MKSPGRSLVQALKAIAFAPRGFGGSITPTRWVGGTPSDAPTTGTYEAGDFVIAKDGTVVVCRAGGSPGAWSTSVTNNTNQSISGTKTFTQQPSVPSLQLGGNVLSVQGGFLYFNGERVLLDSDINVSVAPKTHLHAGNTSIDGDPAHSHTVLVQ